MPPASINWMLERGPSKFFKWEKFYQTATDTILFLGASDSRTESLWSAAFESHTTHSLNLIPQELVSVIQSLLEKPWFYRVWIFQELVLSHDPRIQWGNFRCSWAKFYQFVTELLATTLFKSSTSHQDIGRRFEVLRAMHSAWSVHGASTSSLDYALNAEATEKMSEDLTQLLLVLSSRRGFGLSDGRDMIYVHIGLFRQTGFGVDYQHDRSLRRLCSAL